jgi:hypothetical protein
VNILEDNVGTIKKNSGTIIDAGKEVCLGGNSEKLKYMLLSRHQNAGSNHDMKIANTSFENVSQLKYLQV